MRRTIRRPGRIRWLGILKLAEVEDVTHNVKTFRFRPPDGGTIPFGYLPGQFLTLHLAPRGIPTRRSYTMASTPTWRDRIEIAVKREPHGLVSRFLHDEMRVGDDVKVEAPNGTFIFDGAQADGVALIGAGVGITPMMSVARYLAETGWPGKVSLILGFRAPRDFIFREELEALSTRNPNLERHRHDEQAREARYGLAGTGTSMPLCLLRWRILPAEGCMSAAHPP